MTKPLQSLDELGAMVVREVRTLALLDKPVTYGLPPAHVIHLERVVVAALLDGWGQLADVEGLEPEDFSGRILGHLFAFARSAREEGKSYSDEGVARAFERLGYCRADKLAALLRVLRHDVVGMHGEPLRQAAEQVGAVARWRRFAAEVAQVDAALRHAASVGESVDVERAFDSAAQLARDAGL
jgi:hypothetical protein